MNANMKCPDCHAEYRHVDGSTFICEGCSGRLNQTGVLQQTVLVDDVAGMIVGAAAAAVVFIPM
ncbi:hypothetical protein [Halogeometricum luteum]|uniref:TFIIB zinc-binding n=1 Tax=Halogeometricum luteum TaxID=2950537 RepID=A0ABU2G8H4_9EURY|nr:hypothetical protein [Halogeometricum sp. S3BR5-2]MDS0297105.1 hypothetical protein [Halogeometricum sp. S3BR5-2]